MIDSKTLTSSALDLFPTICEIAGVSYDQSLPGCDLSPDFLKDSKQLAEKRSYIISEINQSAKSKAGKKVVLTGRMVVSAQYKYILFDGGENREQFFDLKKDPGEMNPVTKSSKYKKHLVAHRQMLKEWIAKTSDTFLLGSIPE